MKKSHVALAVLAAALLAGTSAFAADNASQKLPGVSGDYRITKPAPQPDPDDVPTSSDGSFKIGNTDVRIGGSITVDMATGGTRIPNH
ncbi:hypothetical protein AB6802_13970 [Mesorhizobium sp. RCC_202]|uniref:hypothetical protein n=1 Tax=Mesorhizobium sp. RCC_202 TaxID=3239222 RepID=UPI00352627AD